MSELPQGAAVARKLALIIGEIGGITKDGYNAHQKYPYMTDNALKARLRPLFSQYGLAIIPSMVKVEDRAFKTSSGANSYRVTCIFRYTIIDAETGDTMVSEWVADADDMSDKATSKASTFGIKYFLKSLFLIGDKDDDDPDNQTIETVEELPKTAKSTNQASSPVIEASDGIEKVDRVTTKINKNGEPYIVAGGAMFKSRQSFRDLGIDTSGWETLGWRALPFPVWISWELHNGYKTGVGVAKVIEDSINGNTV